MNEANRTVSVDFWRGFALLTIFINHVPGHVLGGLTFRNFGFSDAAELFVLLAGVSAAFAYMRGFEPGARIRVTARIVLRAFQLYVAQLALLMVAVAVVGGFAVWSGDGRLLDTLHLDLILQAPMESIVGMAMMSYQPAYLNILPLYVAILLLAPVLMAAMRVSIGFGLALSGALYLFSLLSGLALPVWPNSGTWYFNPFAWQLLFACGLAIGRMLDQGTPAPGNRLLDAVALLYLVVSMGWVVAGFPVALDFAPVPAFLWDFDKTNLSVPRLAHILALAYLVSRLPLERLLRSAAAAQPLILMGRHALPVFCVGTVLSLAAQVARLAYDGGIALDVLIAGVGITVQWLLAWTLEWHRSGLKSASRRPLEAA
ncbi:OpgC family protein [Aquabacter cavernae]|uniref:OpgC family protein n=1 Tax=Aquabacter cavernae TaxID=2496029 RepID=UPI0013DFB9F8|nr:OpgC domain-containing protein [Aquabacter cavernae]